MSVYYFELEDVADYWNPVKGLLEEFGARIAAFIDGAIKPISDWIWDAIYWVRNRVTDAVTWVTEHIWDPLKNWFTGALGQLKAVFAEAWDWTWNRVKDLSEPWRTLVRIFLLPAATIFHLLKPAIDGIWAIMPQPLKQFVEFLKTLTGKLWEGFIGFLKDPVGTLTEGWNFIAGKVGEIGAGIKTAFDGAYTWLGDNVANPILNGIGQIGGWIADVLKGIVGALGEGIRGFFDWILKHLLWVGEMILGVIQAAAERLGAIISGFTRSLFDKMSGALTPGSPPEELERSAQVWVESLSLRMREIVEETYASPPSPGQQMGAALKIAGAIVGTAAVGLGAAAAADAIHPMKSIQLRVLVSEFLRLTGVATVAAAPFTIMMEAGLFRGLRYSYNELFTPLIPSEGEVVDMATRRILTVTGYHGAMRKQGLSTTWADRRLQASWRIPGVAELNQMLWREKLTSGALEGALRSQGIREDFIPGYVDLTKRIPGPGDLITMVVREVITPRDFARYMPMQGFYPPWPDWYWEMHWILLPLGEVRRARHRGFIDDDELGKYLVLHDYKPEPRPGIGTSDQDLAAKLIWDLPGRIEARWMFRWGVTDRDGLKDLLIKGGLDPDYADTVTDAVAMNQFLREIRAQETNIKADLRDGLIDEATARADLVEIGYPEAFVEYHVKDAVADRERSHKKELLTYFKDCFLKDIPTEPAFEDAVREILVVSEAADLFIERTYVSKMGKKKVEAAPA